MSPLLHLLLLIVFIFSHPCLSAVTITHLPGFSGALPFHLETGYVSVDEVNGVELFYYFAKSERNPSEDPLILWLTGGPGCSGFSGLVFEIGPLKFVTAKYDGSLPSLVYNPYSWTKVANIIFLDFPVGTGFSFSRNSEGYVVNNDTSTSKQAYEFLKKWFIEHPLFLSNHLYIAGDSYGGKIVPVLAQYIDEGVQAGNYPLFNLEGYLVGNPVTGDLLEKNAQPATAHGMGIISNEHYEEIQRECKGEDYEVPNPHNLLCTLALDKLKMFLSELDYAYPLDPHCPPGSPRHMTRVRSVQEKYDSERIVPTIVPDMKCKSYGYYLSYVWANDQKTREALHIEEGTVSVWERCNGSLSYTQNIPSNVMYYLNISKKGYRGLVYSGDKDLIVTSLGTQAWIRSLNFFIVDDWRSWHVNDQVAGYTRKYSNDLTFATIKDAGHTAPEYKPENSFAMFSRWISRKSL